MMLRALRQALAFERRNRGHSGHPIASQRHCGGEGLLKSTSPASRHGRMWRVRLPSQNRWGRLRQSRLSPHQNLSCRLEPGPTVPPGDHVQTAQVTEVTVALNSGPTQLPLVWKLDLLSMWTKMSVFGTLAQGSKLISHHECFQFPAWYLLLLGSAIR